MFWFWSTRLCWYQSFIAFELEEECVEVNIVDLGSCRRCCVLGLGLGLVIPLRCGGG